MTAINPYQPPAGDLSERRGGFVPVPFTSAGQVFVESFRVYFRNSQLVFAGSSRESHSTLDPIGTLGSRSESIPREGYTVSEVCSRDVPSID